MKKISQLEEQLKKREQEITNMYQESLKRLEKSLENEYQETLNTIKEDTKLYQSEIIKQLKKKLSNIDWELEQCRTRKNWRWAIIGGITGILLTIAIIYLITNTVEMTWGHTNYTTKVWYFKWKEPKQMTTKKN